METKRCVLRLWKIEDAPRLNELAKDPDIGPRAGWLPHASIEESKAIIQEILQPSCAYAIVLKETDQIIGCIALMKSGYSNVVVKETEAELGYWLGKNYWGQGLMPEVCQCLIAYGFEKENLERIYCGYYVGNDQSHRVQEKLHFQYLYTIKDKIVLGSKRDEVISKLDREVWQSYENLHCSTW